MSSLLVIEGNIGAGKTSLCKRIAKDFNHELILETFADNPFLAAFYENAARYALPVELFFMAERYKQQVALHQSVQFETNIIADYTFIKTWLFAKKNLHGIELELFEQYFNILNKEFVCPNLLVYLHRPVEILQRQIKRRGRSYERQMPDTYLERIEDAYLEYFANEKIDFPVLILDLGNIDFLENKHHYQNIVELLQKKYPVGVTHQKISD